jgi:hypothetical protein
MAPEQQAVATYFPYRRIHPYDLRRRDVKDQHVARIGPEHWYRDNTTQHNEQITITFGVSFTRAPEDLTSRSSKLVTASLLIVCAYPAEIFGQRPSLATERANSVRIFGR